MVNWASARSVEIEGVYDNAKHFGPNYICMHISWHNKIVFYQNVEISRYYSKLYPVIHILS